MKLITLELLQRYDAKLKSLLETLKPIDPSPTIDELKKELQDAIDKLSGLISDVESIGKDVIDNKTEIDNTISDLEAIINGNKEAIEEAQKKDGELEKALADSIVNIGKAEEELKGIKDSISEIDNDVNSLTINAINAQDQIDALKEKAENNRKNVADLNSALTTLEDGINSDIAQIKTDLGAIDGLAEVQEKIQSIEEIVDALEKDGLTDYVKKEELEDGIMTTMVKVGVVGEDKTVNFYTKDETAEAVETALVKYVKEDDLSTTLTNYYTKSETPEVVKTEMLASGILNKDENGNYITNVYTKTETAAAIASNLADYTNNTLANYSTQSQTAKAITDAVGDLNLNQYSTVTQTAGAIETAIADFDENNIKKNYYDKLETASYVSSQMNSYVDGKLDGYSTVEQTADAIKTAIADVNVDGKLDNYYTKVETAAKVTEQLAAFDANTLEKKYSTQTATAEEIAQTVATFKETELGDILSNYSTLAQTATEIKAELFSAGLTTDATSLTRAVVTAGEVKIAVDSATENLAEKSYVDQKADSITAKVEKLTKGGNTLVPDQVIAGRRSTFAAGAEFELTETEGATWWVAVFNVEEGDKYIVTVQKANTGNQTIAFVTADNKYIAYPDAYDGSINSSPECKLYEPATSLVTIKEDVAKMVVMSRANTNASEQDWSKCITVQKADNNYFASSITQLADKIESKVSSTDYESKVTQLSNSIASKVSSADFTSQVTQLSNNINLKVSKNDVVNQINLSTEKITIDGSKVHITGDTTFDKDVKIKGIIDCDEGVTISGGATTIDKNGMKLTTDDGYTVFDKDGISFVDKGGVKYNEMKRMICGTVADGKYVRFKTPWATIPKVVCTPEKVDLTNNGYSVSSTQLVCRVKDVTVNGFRVECQLQLGGTSTGTGTGTTVTTHSGTQYSDVVLTKYDYGSWQYYFTATAKTRVGFLKVPATSNTVTLELGADWKTEVNEAGYSGANPGTVRNAGKAAGTIVLTDNNGDQIGTTGVLDGTKSFTFTYPVGTTRIYLDALFDYNITVEDHGSEETIQAGKMEVAKFAFKTSKFAIGDYTYSGSAGTTISKGTATFIATDGGSTQFTVE